MCTTTLTFLNMYICFFNINFHTYLSLGGVEHEYYSFVLVMFEATCERYNYNDLQHRRSHVKLYMLLKLD